MASPTVHPTIKLDHKMDCLYRGRWRSLAAAISLISYSTLGTSAIPTFAPKLLEKGEVNPTKVALAEPSGSYIARVCFSSPTNCNMGERLNSLKANSGY
ncbi:hypothetical protein ACP6PM_33265 [Dapis sp. BLCC M229]